MVFIAWLFRIYPTVRWSWPLGGFTILSLLVLVIPQFFYPLLIAEGIVLVGLVVDLLTVSGKLQLRIERSMQRAASLAIPHPVDLVVDNYGRKTVRIEVADDLLVDLTSEPPSHSLTLAGGKRAELRHKLRASRRGAFQLEKIYLRARSRMGFWIRFTDRQVPGTLHVYPDMKQLGEYAILARTNRLSLIGVRQTRKLGQDNNFERHRDYNPDDNYKHIDWRATARRQKLTVKQFQSDQSQRVIFLLDCGRMMTNESRGLSLVDHALNSILMLSYVALQKGDSVGLLSFSDRVHDFVPLRGGASQMNRLLHAGFDRFPSMVPSRFDQAFLYLSTHCRRRSMVVLVTNVVDDVSANQISGYLSNLSGIHLPVLALLRDYRVFDAADNPTMDDDVLYRSAAAAQILTWRHDVLRRLANSGVLVVDAFPDQLTSPLVNQYLEIKAKHLL